MWTVWLIRLICVWGSISAPLLAPGHAWAHALAPGLRGELSDQALRGRPPQGQACEALPRATRGSRWAELPCGAPPPLGLEDGSSWDPPQPAGVYAPFPLRRPNSAPRFEADRPPIQDYVPWWRMPAPPQAPDTADEPDPAEEDLAPERVEPTGGHLRRR